MSDGTFANAYADPVRAAAYATLDFPGTYSLAFRDLAGIIGEHVRGALALDFGCGAGRSTRFLAGMGFETLGVDISRDMIEQARTLDPAGEYLLIPDGEVHLIPAAMFDLVLCAFTFDNIAGVEHRVRLLAGLGDRLRPDGRLILLGSTPELYTHDWASFTTTAFPENARARSGDVVRVIMRDVEDRRPVEDILWVDEDYRAAFRGAGLEVLSLHKPLATGSEPYEWVNETTVAPWVIYVAGRSTTEGRPRGERGGDRPLRGTL